MNNFIKDEHKGIEVGSGAGFIKDFIKNKNLKLTDLGDDDHLDFKKIDAQNTGLKERLCYSIEYDSPHTFPIKFFER